MRCRAEQAVFPKVAHNHGGFIVSYIETQSSFDRRMKEHTLQIIEGNYRISDRAPGSGHRLRGLTLRRRPWAQLSALSTSSGFPYLWSTRPVTIVS